MLQALFFYARALETKDGVLTSMYVCICNALRDKELEAASADARNVADVFRACGRRPQCGKCVHDVAAIIEDARAKADGPVPVIAAE